MIKIKFLLISIFSLFFLLLSPIGITQNTNSPNEYPLRPVKIVIPLGAGGGTDILGRILAQKLSERLSKPFIVENRPGAGSTIGTLAVAKSPNDGYTLLLSAIGTYASAMAYDQKLNYGNMRVDFAAISLLGTSTLIIAVNPNLGVKNVRELISLAKNKPGVLNFGSSGTGGLSHLSGEMFKQLSETNLTHVPYKGTAQILPAIISGEVSLTFDTPPAYLAFIKEGKLRTIAVGGSKRSAFLPDVPTISESGLPGYESVASYGLYAPAGTAKEILLFINREVNLILQMPELKEILQPLGIEPLGSSPEVLSTFTDTEISKWMRVVKSGNIKAD
jgi:tripartite-type tricarboxylate transporter receptor subunit TctC